MTGGGADNRKMMALNPKTIFDKISNCTRNMTHVTSIVKSLTTLLESAGGGGGRRAAVTAAASATSSSSSLGY